MAGLITSGMDVAQVRQLAADLKRAAEDISRIGQQVTSKLQSTPWEGADRKRFEADWTSRQRAQIQQLTNSLNEASQSATKNAADQENTSRN